MSHSLHDVQFYQEQLGSGFPIVMLHGFSLDHRIMQGCMEPVFAEREGFRRLYIDLPGMGKTQNYDSVQNTDDMLEAVLHWIDRELSGKPFLLAGESYGGFLARGVIEKRREQVKGALFICPSVIPQMKLRTLPEKALLVEDKLLWDKLTETERTEFASMAVVATNETWERYKTEIMSGYHIANFPFLERLKTSYGFSFPLDTQPFSHPSLFVVGKQDHIVGYQDAWSLLPHYPRSSFAVLDCAGHNLQIEQPALFTELVHEWLDRGWRGNWLSSRSRKLWLRHGVAFGEAGGCGAGPFICGTSETKKDNQPVFLA